MLHTNYPHLSHASDHISNGIQNDFKTYDYGSVESAMEAIKKLGLSRENLQAVLKAINVRGIHRSHKNTRIKVLASKTMHCYLSIGSALDLIDQDLGEPETCQHISDNAKQLQLLETTYVTICEEQNRLQTYKWLDSDVSLYKNGKLLSNGYEITRKRKE